MSAVSVRTPVLTSRLPQVGTTIFTVMSALATQHKAVNLGQGFPDFDCDPALLDAVNTAMRSGLNQYPPMAGVPALREAIARKIHTLYGGRYDTNDEITVTAGATQAILTAILCLVMVALALPFAYLRNFVYGFAELLSDRLTRALIMRAMEGGAENYEL